MNLAELCCGSAALTLHLHGSAPPMPYMGSKARYVQAITETFGLTRPERVVLADTGMWSSAWFFLHHKREALVAEVRRQVDAMGDPREAWEVMRKGRPSRLLPRTAQWLVLQRLAFSGKPVTWTGSGWSDPGFQETAAYGRAGTDRFGEVAPQLPGLAGRLAALPVLADCRVCCNQDARRVDLGGGDLTGWVVYIDPPYAGTTGYGPSDLVRPDVLALADRYSRRGAHVIVSEAEPLALPGEWHYVEITHLRTGKKSSWQRAEWLTSNRAPVQPRLFAEVAP